MRKSQIAASILRNIISSTLSINPRHISLGGEISPNWIGASSLGMSYMDYSDKGDLSVRAWHPTRGFADITEKSVDQNQFSHGNHDQTMYEGSPLHEVVRGDELFFLIGNGEDNNLRYTLFKAPNFEEHFSNLETADVQRWTNWI